jgi:FixJ family two-component response regulator
MQETVFIVDDDEAVRDSLQWLIETEGYQVKTYEDPELFLEQLAWPQPCVLLLDIRMPKLSGLEVQKTLNARYSNSYRVYYRPRRCNTGR